MSLAPDFYIIMTDPPQLNYWASRMLKGKKWLLGKLEKQINALRLHLITNTEVLGELDAATKYNNRKGFLDCLREAGEQTADHWLDAHADALGKRETCDLTATF